MRRTTWGDKFAPKGLLLSPNVAQMYTTGEIAANICLETPGLDTLDILVFWKGFPTYASTQTIFTILKANWYYLEQNKFVEWDVDGARRRRRPRPARDRHRGAVGRHRASRSGSATIRASPIARRWAACSRAR